MSRQVVRRSLRAKASNFLLATAAGAAIFPALLAMPREIITLECTEAKAEGKPTSRYVTTRNKKSLRTPGRLEKVKFNPFLKRRTLHREIR